MPPHDPDIHGVAPDVNDQRRVKKKEEEKKVGRRKRE
jgi:hypothetical protein